MYYIYIYIHIYIYIYTIPYNIIACSQIWCKVQIGVVWERTRK